MRHSSRGQDGRECLCGVQQRSGTTESGGKKQRQTIIETSNGSPRSQTGSRAGPDLSQHSPQTRILGASIQGAPDSNAGVAGSVCALAFQWHREAEQISFSEVCAVDGELGSDLPPLSVTSSLGSGEVLRNHGPMSAKGCCYVSDDSKTIWSEMFRGQAVLSSISILVVLPVHLQDLVQKYPSSSKQHPTHIPPAAAAVAAAGAPAAAAAAAAPNRPAACRPAQLTQAAPPSRPSAPRSAGVQAAR